MKLGRFLTFTKYQGASVTLSQTQSYNNWYNKTGEPRQSYNYHGNTTKSRSPTVQEIKSFLQLKNLKARSGPTCFRCESVFPEQKSVGRPKKYQGALSLFINKTTGDFFCSKTGRSGSWEELQDVMKNPTLRIKGDLPPSKADPDFKKVQEIWEASKPLSEMSDLTKEEIFSKFGLDALPLSALEMYDIRLGEDLKSVIIPWFSNTNSIGCGKHLSKGLPIGLKVVSVEENTDSKQFETMYYPSKNYSCMLGLSHVPVSCRAIVLTMNEFDALAINSTSTKFKAVSLPCGTTHLPLDVLPYLEQFTEVTLWFDNTQISWETARQFAKKLDEKRCRLVRPTTGTPSPLEALSRNLDLDDIISSSVSAEIKNIVSFTDLRGFVMDELMNCDTVCGVGWSRFPKLTKMLKGHRRGELSVVTGPTGSGKTTFMSEYSIDLAAQGVSTLWGSFEIQNVRLLKTMMKQFSRSRLEKQMTDFENIAAKFQMLPIHFMTYNGPQSIQDVIHTMRQTAYAYDIQHIIIDNLQFMMGSVSKNMDRFMVQDTLISEFRNFATTENIHVTVVIHPRKEDPGLPLQISSIFGTAKATQEADNVLILQQVTRVEEGNSFKKSYVEVVKNRYDGELGRMGLNFDKNTLCMSKPPESVDKSLAESLNPVENETKVQLNGDGIYFEESEQVETTPEWIQNLQD